MLFTVPRLRGTDKQGSGAYGAPRGDRLHKGVDYAVQPGTRVYSAVRGVVSRVGFLYVLPSVTKGATINKGYLLGTAQKLPYKGITQHVHVDVRQMVGSRRKFVDPVTYFEDYWG